MELLDLSLPTCHESHGLYLSSLLTTLWCIIGSTECKFCVATTIFLQPRYALHPAAAGPVLDLSFLIDHVMMDIKPLHWGDVISSDVPLKVGEPLSMNRLLNYRRTCQCSS